MGEPGVERHDELGTVEARADVFAQLPTYAIGTVGPNHQVAAATQACVDLLGGLTPIGQHVADTIRGAVTQGMVDYYDRAFRGETVTGERARFAIVTHDGTERELFFDFDLVPWRDEHGTIIGVISVSRDVTSAAVHEREQSDAVTELHHRFQRATDVIDAVQRALLPSRLPVLPSLDIAASYVIGAEAEAAGGDWFEVIPREGGTVAAAVGDVVGHGVAAAVVMAQLRAVTLERLHAGATVADTVAALDRFVEVLPEGRSATICVLELDPRTGALEYCSAGHLPPLVLDPTGESTYLEPSGEGPLGATEQRRSISAALTEEQVLLLYTDGIVERPGVPATTGTVELGSVANDAARDQLMPAFSFSSAVDRCTTQTLERLSRHTGSSDDITLLALQRASRLEPLRLQVDAGAGTVEIRRVVRGWFRDGQIGTTGLDEIDQVTTELCENVAEHAYGGAGGPITFEARLDDDGMLHMCVADQGRWRPPPLPNVGRGIGLALVQQLARRVTIEPGDVGTVVRVEMRPWKPSHDTTARRPAPADDVFDVYLDDRVTESPTLRVRGPVDATAFTELESQLRLSTVPRSPELTVDLDAVTVLSSVAIRHLREAVERASGGGTDVRLVCRPGTVAHHVLSLAGIATDPPDRRSKPGT